MAGQRRASHGVKKTYLKACFTKIRWEFKKMISTRPMCGISENSFENGNVLLWDVQTGELRGELAGHENGVSSLAFTLDGNLLVSGSYDGEVIVWGIRP